MAVIESGLGSDLLTIESLTKAAKVSVVDSLGLNVNAIKDKFHLGILPGRITAAIAAGSYLWAIRNGLTKRMKINKLELLSGFDGTATATTQQFELVRVLSGSITGGTPLTLPAQVSRKSTQGPATTLADARFSGAAALTVTGVTFETAVILTFGTPRSATSQNAFFDFSDDLDIWLEPGEGLAIRTAVATVVGDSVTGIIGWTEE